MPAVVPTLMINVPDYGQILDEAGVVRTVGPWLALDYRLIDGVPTPVSPQKPVVMLVPNEAEAVATIAAHFHIYETRVERLEQEGQH
jgi:hypothetical protein